MPYNPQFYTTNITGLPDLMGWANALSGGVIAPLSVFALWFIIFLSSSSAFHNMNKGFAFSSVFALLITTAYIALEWMPGWTIGIPLVMVGFAGALTWVNRD